MSPYLRRFTQMLAPYDRKARGEGIDVIMAIVVHDSGWASLEDNLVFLSHNFPRNHYFMKS